MDYFDTGNGRFILRADIGKKGMFGEIIALGIAAYFFWLAQKNGKSGWKYGLLSLISYVIPFTVIFHLGFSMFVNYFQIPVADQDTFRLMAGVLTIAFILFFLSETKKRILKVE